MGGKRNRQAGHNFELEIAREFRELGYPHVVTTRSESRSRDDQKIDLMNKDEAKNGRFPFNIQVKNSTVHLRYAKILSELPSIPGIINVVIHKQTERVNNRFLPKGKYAILNLSDFLSMVNKINQYESKAVGGQMVPTLGTGSGKALHTGVETISG